jgi:hypothetical protein
MGAVKKYILGGLAVALVLLLERLRELRLGARVRTQDVVSPLNPRVAGTVRNVQCRRVGDGGTSP